VEWSKNVESFVKLVIKPMRDVLVPLAGVIDRKKEARAGARECVQESGKTAKSTRIIPRRLFGPIGSLQPEIKLAREQKYGLGAINQQY
jgi:hypothetical protein